MQSPVVLFLLLMIFAVFMLASSLSSITAGNAGASRSFLNPIGSMWGKRASFRCEAMSEVGVIWKDMPTSFVSNTSIMGLVCKSPKNVRVLGMMEMDVDGRKIQLFDVLAALSSRRKPYRNGFQSFMTATLSEGIDLPHFFIYPGALDVKRTITTYDEVNLEVLSMGDYVLESPQPFHARSLFDTDYAYDVFLPFVRSHSWSAEWNGSKLLIYRWNELLEPRDIQMHTQQLLQLADLLKPLSEAFLARQDQEMKMMAARINA